MMNWSTNINTCKQVANTYNGDLLTHEMLADFCIQSDGHHLIHIQDQQAWLQHRLVGGTLTVCIAKAVR